MPAVLASEWRKLRGTPTMWWLLLGVVCVGIAATLGAIVLDNAKHLIPNGEPALRDDMHSAGTGSVLVAVAGVLTMAGEFRHGQADQTFISSPRRSLVVWAKVILFAMVGAGFGLTAIIAGLVTTMVWLATKGQSLPLGHEVIWLTSVGAIASAMLFAVLGVGVGGATRTQVTAIVLTLAWLIVVEPILKQISDPVARWLPGNAAFALRRVPENGLASMGAGAIALFIWAALAVAVGLHRTVREDIS